MTDRLAQHDPLAWLADDVIVIRPPRQVIAKAAVRRAANQSSRASIGLSFALAVATAVSFSPSSGGRGGTSNVIVARERLVEPPTKTRAGPSRDVVPSGYWTALGQRMDRMPTLEDDDDADESEPFI